MLNYVTNWSHGNNSLIANPECPSPVSQIEIQTVTWQHWIDYIVFVCHSDHLPFLFVEHVVWNQNL